MNKYFFAEALASRPLLWEAMLRANARKQPSALEEEAAVLGADAASLLGWLGEGPFAVSAPAAEGAFWDYAEESRRLALGSPEEMKALCCCTGVALHAADIARVIRKDEVLALRASLGELLYRYALRRGQYQLGSVRQLFASCDRDLSLFERCRLHGIMALHLVASLWPEDRAASFVALFPLPEGRALPELTEDQRRSVWFAVKKLFLREVAPSWAACFD